MQILQKRQTGESAIPASLAYGELAVDKSGGLYVGAEDGSVLDLGLPIERNTEGLSNLGYDVKMLQLQEIAQNVTPPMMGGFIEAYRDKSMMNEASSHGVTVDTSSHCCNFDGTEDSGEAPGGSRQYSNSKYTGEPMIPPNSGEYVISFSEWQQAKKVTLNFTGEYKKFDYPTMSDATLAVYGGETAESCNTSLKSTTVERPEGGSAMSAELNLLTPYPYYRLTVTYDSAMPDGEMILTSCTDKGSFEKATAYGQVKLTYTKPVIVPVEGSYETKEQALGVQVTGGDLYLHYAALPAEASLVPEVKLGGEFLELSAENERDVTLGGVALKERRYRIPVQAESSDKATVRVTGNRKAVGDSVALYDIVVALF